MKYIIDSEVLEEITEIISLIDIVADNNVIICCPKDISDKLAQPYKIYSYKRSQNRIINKVVQMSLLLSLMIRHRPDILFSGYPLFKHRVLSIMSFNKVRHYSYLRGLFADSKNYRGFSDKLYLVIKKINFFYKINNFQCDKIITISKLNVDFLLERGVKSEVIQLISPPWLKQIELEKTGFKESDNINGIIYFVSQAFDAHSLSEAAESQIDFALQLQKSLDASGDRLIVRKHPRDYTNYEKYGLEFNCASSYEFIKSLSKKDILISPFSTLAFEAAYFDIKSIFYSTRELDQVYAGIYRKMAIKPLYKPYEIMLQIDNIKTEVNNYSFNNVFFK